jgi:hypothetical protein
VTKLRIQWLQAHVSYWSKLESKKGIEQRKSDVDFCVDHHLLALEDDSPTYKLEVQEV